MAAGKTMIGHHGTSLELQDGLLYSWKIKDIYQFIFRHEQWYVDSLPFMFRNKRCKLRLYPNPDPIREEGNLGLYRQCLQLYVVCDGDIVRSFTSFIYKNGRVIKLKMHTIDDCLPGGFPVACYYAIDRSIAMDPTYLEMQIVCEFHEAPHFQFITDTEDDSFKLLLLGPLLDSKEHMEKITESLGVKLNELQQKINEIINVATRNAERIQKLTEEHNNLALLVSNMNAEKLAEALSLKLAEIREDDDLAMQKEADALGLKLDELRKAHELAIQAANLNTERVAETLRLRLMAEIQKEHDSAIEASNVNMLRIAEALGLKLAEIREAEYDLTMQASNINNDQKVAEALGLKLAELCEGENDLPMQASNVKTEKVAEALGLKLDELGEAENDFAMQASNVKTEKVAEALGLKLAELGEAENDLAMQASNVNTEKVAEALDQRLVELHKANDLAIHAANVNTEKKLMAEIQKEHNLAIKASNVNTLRTAEVLGQKLVELQQKANDLAITSNMNAENITLKLAKLQKDNDLNHAIIDTIKEVNKTVKWTVFIGLILYFFHILTSSP